MKMPANLKFALPLFIWLALFAVDAHAEIDGSDVLDSVLARYQTASSAWAAVITSSASWLFWTLVVISMVWTFGMMALRKADIGEFFAEFVRFTIFTGFFWWLLLNGPNFATSIYTSLRQLGGNATGLGSALSPSGVVDVGFAIFDKVIDQSSIWSPVDSACGIIIAAIILVILALVGVNMLLLLISGWILAYGGIFFLGFGGSRWTSDMAINYYKTVLGIAAQLFVIVLIVGIGKTFLDDYYLNMSDNITIKEIGVMLIVAVILLMLVNKLPQLVSGIITGASVGGSGIGQFGAGAAVGAVGMATAGAAVGGAMIASGAASAAGGAQAVMAAFSKASENVASGTDVLTSSWGGGGGGGGGGSGRSAGGDSGTGSTPFAQAAGFAGGGSGIAGAVSSGGSMAAESKFDDGDAGGKSGGSQASSENDSTDTVAAKGGAATEGKTAAGEADSMTSISQPPSQAGESESMSAVSSSGSMAAESKSDDANTADKGGGNSQPAAASGGLLAAASKAGKITADAGANLVKGAAVVAKAKAASIKEAAMERIAETTGGKIAAAIKNLNNNSSEAEQGEAEQTATPSFSGNSLAGEKGEADTDSEVAAFVNRGQKS
jgi:type IV secretion system protein VirB6/type IV secretion system protein TrbL